ILLCDRALRLLVVVPRPSRIDVKGALLLTGSVTALLLMLSWGGTAYNWLSVPVITVGLLGFLLLLGLVMQEQRAADPLLPPRLFTNDIFLRGVSVAFFGSLGLFVATFLLPINFQLVHGYGPETSGLLVMPFLVSSTVGAYAAGQLARRLGKSKVILLLGLGSAILGFLLLTLDSAETSAILIMVESVVLGTGIGMCMPTSIVVVQNAVEHRDIGTATGSLLLLRSIGGAFGSTVAGSLLTLRFRQSEHAAHLRHAIDFGALSQGAHALDGLSERAHDAIRHGLASGFSLAYLVTALVLCVAILVVAGLRDIALRSSIKPEGPAIGH
ncbi:MAG TPA: MFS transporter, partial [Acidisoma sp.]|nr:MFS transporter [Acidisoma sp.]